MVVGDKPHWDSVTAQAARHCEAPMGATKDDGAWNTAIRGDAVSDCLGICCPVMTYIELFA